MSEFTRLTGDELAKKVDWKNGTPEGKRKLLGRRKFLYQKFKYKGTGKHKRKVNIFQPLLIFDPQSPGQVESAVYLYGPTRHEFPLPETYAGLIRHLKGIHQLSRQMYTIHGLPKASGFAGWEGAMQMPVPGRVLNGFVQMREPGIPTPRSN